MLVLSMPLLSHQCNHIYTDKTHTHVYIYIHPHKSTNILASLLHPACLEWQGEWVRDDNMAAVISSTRSLGLEQHEAEAVSQEEVTRVWRGGLLSNQEDCWSLATLPAWATLLLSTDRQQRRREVWPGNSLSAFESGPWVCVWGQTERGKHKQKGNEWENQSNLVKQTQ